MSKKQKNGNGAPPRPEALRDVNFRILGCKLRAVIAVYDNAGQISRIQDTEEAFFPEALMPAGVRALLVEQGFTDGLAKPAKAEQPQPAQ